MLLLLLTSGLSVLELNGENAAIAIANFIVLGFVAGFFAGFVPDMLAVTKNNSLESTPTPAGEREMEAV